MNSLRVVLVPLFGSGIDAAVLHVGLAIAGRFGAHVDALFVRIDPADAIPVIGEGVSPAIIDQLTQAAAAEMTRQSGAARAAFEAACAKAGVALIDAPDQPGKVSAGWTELIGRRDDVIARKARVSDLTVLHRPDCETPPELAAVLEAALLGGGRPLLIIPPGEPSVRARNIAIAWNGSTEAARAVAAALPFLDGAGTAHVLTAPTWRTKADLGLDLAAYLAWHGITCQRHTVAGGENEPVGAALLRTATDVGADLMVMGGYGRTRFSELVLGGVTRHVLTAANLPVLLSH